MLAYLAWRAWEIVGVADVARLLAGVQGEGEGGQFVVVKLERLELLQHHVRPVAATMVTGTKSWGGPWKDA